MTWGSAIVSSVHVCIYAHICGVLCKISSTICVVAAEKYWMRSVAVGCACRADYYAFSVFGYEIPPWCRELHELDEPPCMWILCLYWMYLTLGM